MAFYLVFDKKAQQIFEFKEEEYEDVIYIMWLTNFISAIVGACQYNNGIWKNPYSQERFMFLNYVYQNQEVNKEILKFNIDENNQSFKMEINKTNLIKYGKDITAKILMQIHISKCIGDVKAAKEFVNKYSVVDEFMYQINSMIPCSDVIKIRMNVDLIKKEEDKKEIIEINQYPSTSIGFIKNLSFLNKNSKFNKKNLFLFKNNITPFKSGKKKIYLGQISNEKKSKINFRCASAKRLENSNNFKYKSFFIKNEKLNKSSFNLNKANDNNKLNRNILFGNFINKKSNKLE
jgi:hypothetical protein